MRTLFIACAVAVLLLPAASEASTRVPLRRHAQARPDDLDLVPAPLGRPPRADAPLRRVHAKRGTFVPTRPPKCRVVVVSGPGGQSQTVVVC